MRSTLRSDIGRVRTTNQDVAFARHGLYAVCDGMGGHKGGHTAAAMATQTLLTLTGKEAHVRTLTTALEGANHEIRIASAADPALSGMGTTATVLWASPEAVLLAQVGDSRAYLLRGGVLRQCTHDHTIVSEMVRRGVLTDQEALNHPQRHVITRAVGTEAKVLVDLFEIARRKGDLWLLCSDGLTGMVRDDEIRDILSRYTLEGAADALLRLSLERGGTDNVSLVLIADDEGVIL